MGRKPKSIYSRMCIRCDEIYKTKTKSSKSVCDKCTMENGNKKKPVEVVYASIEVNPETKNAVFKRYDGGEL